MVTFSISGYKKDPAFILSQIRPLHAYEVDLEAAGGFGISGLKWPHFYHGIHSIEVLSGRKHRALWDEWGVHENDWYFMPLAMNPYSGFGQRTVDGQSLGIMWDTNPVRQLIQSVNRNFESLSKFYPADLERDYADEKEKLIVLEKLLSDPLMDDAVVSCSWG